LHLGGLLLTGYLPEYNTVMIYLTFGVLVGLGVGIAVSESEVTHGYRIKQ
jgi:hypothetical protein